MRLIRFPIDRSAIPAGSLRDGGNRRSLRCAQRLLRAARAGDTNRPKAVSDLDLGADLITCRVGTQKYAPVRSLTRAMNANSASRHADIPLWLRGRDDGLVADEHRDVVEHCAGSRPAPTAQASPIRESRRPHEAVAQGDPVQVGGELHDLGALPLAHRRHLLVGAVTMSRRIVQGLSALQERVSGAGCPASPRTGRRPPGRAHRRVLPQAGEELGLGLAQRHPQRLDHPAALEPGQHHQGDEGGEDQGEPAALDDLHRVGRQEHEVDGQEGAVDREHERQGVAPAQGHQPASRVVIAIRVETAMP